MPDQAEGLRKMMRRLKRARVVAVTSGKGGVGKTSIAVNMAIAAAASGKRVILLDMDLGLANADVLLNVAARYNISHLIAGRKSVREICLAAPGGIILIPGASGLGQLANLSDAEREELLRRLEPLEGIVDLIIADTGAGVSRNVLGIAAAANDAVIVSTPEPTSIVDAYATIKLLSRERDCGNLHLLVNMAQTRLEANRVAGKIVSVAQQALGSYVEPLGFVLADPAMPESIRCRRPLMIARPHSPAARCVRSVTAQLLGPGDREAVAGGFFEAVRRFFRREPAAAAAGMGGRGPY